MFLISLWCLNRLAAPYVFSLRPASFLSCVKALSGREVPFILAMVFSISRHFSGFPFAASHLGDSGNTLQRKNKKFLSCYYLQLCFYLYSVSRHIQVVDWEGNTNSIVGAFDTVATVL